MHAKHWGDFYEPDSDANQFRLESSILIFFLKISSIFKKNWKKVFKITWIWGMCWNVSKNQFFRFFWLLFFELSSFLYSNYGQFSMNFQDNSKYKNRKDIYFIRFSTLRNFRCNGSKTEGRVCISLVGKYPTCQIFLSFGNKKSNKKFNFHNYEENISEDT